ncbi:MAG: hypothetical protein U0X87_01825 [Anaerolineales bacterium]
MAVRVASHGVRVTRRKWLEITLLGSAGGALILATYSRGGLPYRGAATVLTFLLRSVALELSPTRKCGLFLKDIAPRSVDSGSRRSSARDCSLRKKGYIARMFESDAESVQEFVVENSAGARSAYLVSALGVYEEWRSRVRGGFGLK